MRDNGATNEVGFQTGDTFITYNFVNPNSKISQQPVIISGVWRPLDANSSYWFITPTALDDTLVITEATFTEQLASAIPNVVNRALWYFVLDGRDVNTTDVDRLLTGALRVARQVDNLLPNTRDVVSPIDALAQYRCSNNS